MRILWGLVLFLTLPVVFSREEGTISRRDFFVGCPNALAAAVASFVTDRWFTPHFSVLARSCIDAWMADVACPIVCQPVWPACWVDTLDRSSSSATRVVQDVWDVYRDELGVVPQDVVLALRDAVSRSSVDDFWTIWSQSAEAGLFRGLAMVMRLMCIALSTLLIPRPSRFTHFCDRWVPGGSLSWGELCESLSPLEMGEWFICFVITWYQGAEEDAEKLQLTDKLLQRYVLVSPCLLLGILMLILLLFPCLAKAISAGRFVDLPMAYSLRERQRLAATCKFQLDECSGTMRLLLPVLAG